MKKIGKSRFYPVLVLSMLTLLIVSGGIYMSSTTKQSMQSLETSPVTLQTMAENNVLYWNTTWGSAGYEENYGIAMDTSGNIYCIGYTSSFGAGGDDLALVKFAPNSMRLWNITWGGTNYEYGEGVAVDASGSVYCTGNTDSFGAGNADLVLVKFAPNGTQLWNTTWGGTENDGGNGVAVDASGNIYCAGYTSSFGAGGGDLVLVKFAPNGTQLWNTTWGWIGSDSGKDVTVDASGSVYCVGDTTSFGAGSYDFALVKVAPNGTRLWNTTWGGANSDNGYGVAVDASGSVFCAGNTASFGAGNYDLVLVKFASTGVQLWNTTWGGAMNDIDDGVAVDASGNIYCAGYTSSFGAGSGDLALVKFAPNGTRLWNITWGGTSNDVGAGLALDASGSIYCAGTTDSFGAGSADFALVKFGFPTGSEGIPSFDIFYLLCGLVALIYLAQRRKSSRPTP